MVKRKFGRQVGECVCLVAAVFLVTPALARAQNVGIAGVVRDGSGAVMPGVTVEAASPALIEKVRTVFTNEEGLYQIVDLRPGTYTVTFSLAGFTTVKREGIVLQGTFIATVNAELGVGTMEETLTVTGDSPDVDIRNVVQQRVLTDDVREALPTGRSVQMMAQTIPGMIPATGAGRPSGQDVGGVSAERNVLVYHGGGGFLLEVDGIHTHITAAAGGFAISLNPGDAQEYVYETSGISAATMIGGLHVNVIPKEGGNRSSGSLLATYANDHFVSNNVSQELRDRGLTSANKVLNVWDYNASVGGPIRRDKVWFFASFRYWGQHEQIPGMFRPIDPVSFTFIPALGAAGNVDLNRPAIYTNWLTSTNARVTWQASPRNKFTFMTMQQPRLQEQGLSATRSYEASGIAHLKRNQMYQVGWKSPRTSRLLFEGAFGGTDVVTPQQPTVPGIEKLVSVRDSGTGITYRGSPLYTKNTSYAPTLKGAISYVTGSHALKFGAEYGWGAYCECENYMAEGMTFTFRNGIPQSLTVYNVPRNVRRYNRYTGVYVQEQWTIRRLTANLGLRFDTRQGWADGESGPGPFAPKQVAPVTRGIPDWNDISPRFGVAYDLFGNGKTALKATLGRYVDADGGNAITQNHNVAAANYSATRQWSDINRDYVPQESELGPLSNANFATTIPTLRLDDSAGKGWGVRSYNWESSASVQHQLLPQLSVNGGYFHRAFGNFILTDNLLVTPANYDQFCITAPVDARLPDGVSGSAICGLYDLNPSKVGLVDTLTTAASNFGEQTATFDGVDFGFDMRIPKYGAAISGGLSTGDGYTNNGTDLTRAACFVVDSPQSLRFCEVQYPWRTAFKLNGTVRLPLGVDMAMTFQSNPGPEIQANYAIPNAAATAALGRAPTTSQSILLYGPGTTYLDNMEQVDLRIAKRFNFKGARWELSAAVGNLLNASPVLALNNTFGPNWQTPTYILPGRIVRPQLKLDW